MHRGSRSGIRIRRVAVIAAFASLSILSSGSLPAPAQPAQRTVAVAAASDLQTVFSELRARFERDTGIKVTASFGSSGNFFAQIQNGAPFDVFMSADLDYPRQLIGKGLADAGSEYEYATGRIVLWTRRDSGIDVAPGLGVLKSASVRRIAIANPQVAPYGRAAVAALRQQNLYDTVQAKLVFGENISQTAQLVESGNADVGILSKSLALGPALRAGRSFDIPASAHPPIAQAAVVISASRNKDAAVAFVNYLKRPEARQLLQNFGLEPPSPNR